MKRASTRMTGRRPGSNRSIGRALAALILLLTGMLEASGALIDTCALEPSIVPNRGGGYDVVVEAAHGIMPGVERRVMETVVVARAFAKAAEALLQVVVLDNFGRQVPARSVDAIVASGLAVVYGEEPYHTCHTVEERDQRRRRAMRVCVGEDTLGVVEMEFHEFDGGLHVWQSSVAVERAGALTSVRTSRKSEMHTLNGELAYVVGATMLASGQLSDSGLEVVAAEVPGADRACVRVHLLGVAAVPGRR